MKYQEQGVVDIWLDMQDREAFALGELSGFSVAETIEGGQYKERVHLTTISLRDSDKTWWSYQWSEDVEGWSTEGNDYTMDDSIHRVRPIELGLDRKVLDWVRVKK